jgi:hemolysin III
MKTNHEGEAEHFSPLSFAITVTVSLIVYLGFVFAISPSHFMMELEARWWQFALSFLFFHLANTFFEFFFHRYVLHMPAIPILKHFYRQHTLHHSLTRVRLVEARGGERGTGTVENIYPILEEFQHEASFFPWYSYAIFAILATPLFWLVGQFFGTAPVFISGALGLTFSLVLYETLHAIEHWSLERWRPKLEHPRFGTMWKILYAFHLRHHADKHYKSNEAISGFFGLPLPDWLFGTYMNHADLFVHGSPGTELRFESPVPCRFIEWLDGVAEDAVERRKRNRREKMNG